MLNIDKKIIMILAIMLYVISMFVFVEEKTLNTVFWGADYNADSIFYALHLLLFSIVLFYKIGDTERYLHNQGMIELLRYKKKATVIKHIIINNVVDSLIVTSSTVTMYIITYSIYKKGNIDVNIDFLENLICLLMIFILIVQMESIIEILYDARISILAVLSIILVNLWVGDFIVLRHLNNKIIPLFFINMGTVFRRERIDISFSVIFFIFIILFIIETVAMNYVYKRKDII